eukprot:scaffold7252_cov65-Cylindrotheca_fusiformis.AAC.1
MQRAIVFQLLQGRYCHQKFLRKKALKQSDKTYLRNLQKKAPVVRQSQKRDRPLAQNTKYLRRAKKNKSVNSRNPSRLQQATIHTGTGILLEPVDHSPRVLNSTPHAVAVNAEQDRMRKEFGEGFGPTEPPDFCIRPDQQTSPTTYLQQLIDRFGNKRPYPMFANGFPHGRWCACAGCNNPNHELGRSGAQCSQCQIVVHKQCCRERNWWWFMEGEDEYVYFCSDQCKRKNRDGTYL